MFEAHQLVVRRWLRAEEQFVELSDRRAIQLYGSLEKTNKARERNTYRPAQKNRDKCMLLNYWYIKAAIQK